MNSFSGMNDDTKINKTLLNNLNLIIQGNKTSIIEINEKLCTFVLTPIKNGYYFFYNKSTTRPYMAFNTLHACKTAAMT